MPENGDTEYGENGNHEVFGYGQLGEIGFVSVVNQVVSVPNPW